MSEENQATNEDQSFDEAFDEATGVEPSVEDQAQEESSQDAPVTDELEVNLDAPEKTVDELMEQVAQLEADREKYRHQFESNNGRISSYQNEINALKQQLQQPQQQKPEKPKTDEEWEAIKEDYPEIAAGIEKRIQAEIQQNLEAEARARQDIATRLESRLTPIEQREQQQLISQQYAALEAAHPDYVDVANSQEFVGWLQTQPQPVQQLMNSNAASDAAFLLDSYKALTGKQAPTEANEGANLQQQRQQRLRQSVAAPSRRQARTEVAKDDFDAAWEAATANL